MAIYDCLHPHLRFALQRIAQHKVSTHPVYAPHSVAKHSLLDVQYAVLYSILVIIEDVGDLRIMCIQHI